MNTNQEASSNGQPKQEDLLTRNPNSSELLERIAVKDTAFHITGNKTMAYFITLGKYKLSNGFTTPEEAIKHIKRKPWDLIFALATCAAHATYEDIADQHTVPYKTMKGEIKHLKGTE